jgi:putative ABC transport system permease protein
VIRSTAGLLLRNLRRNPRPAVLAAFGVMLGVASLAFFVALGTGLQRNVLDRIYVVNRFEVVPRTVDIGVFRTSGLFGAAGFQREDVARIAAVPGVVRVFPKQDIAFSAYAFGGETILGETLWTELVGDGMPAELGPDDLHEVGDPNAFVDWEAERICSDDATCAPGSSCIDQVCAPVACQPDDEIWAGSDAGALERLADDVSRGAGIRRRNLEIRRVEGDVARPWRLVVNTGEALEAQAVAARSPHARGGVAVDFEAQSCDRPSYCHPQRRVCVMPVPVLASRLLLELYNTNIQNVLAEAEGPAPPRLSESALIGLSFGARLGEGFLGQAYGDDGARVPVETIRLRLVGFSDQAIPVGVTVPLPYVQRWNARFADAERASRFDSVLVETADSASLHRAVDVVTRELGYDIDARYRDAERASLTLALVTGVLGLFSALIVGLAGLNVANTFLMIVGERRREIGVMRALGARRRLVTALVLGEAAVVGLLGLVLGLLVAVGAMWAVDGVFTRAVPDFPFKPDTLFALRGIHVVAAALLAQAACLLGALVPARRAAALDPVEATRP